MAIREFAPEGSPRAKIAFVGDMPNEDGLKPFKDRNYGFELFSVAELGKSEIAAQLDAVLWTQDAEKINALPREIQSVAANLLDHDVRIYLRLASDANRTDTPRRLVVNALSQARLPVANLWPTEWEETPANRRERQNSFLSPSVYIFDSASSWADIATVVCDRPAGPAPTSTLDFDEEAFRKRFGNDGHPERMLLIKRAFWNCSDLRLVPLTGGLSGAPVFRAYAALDAGLVQHTDRGAYPHLYFVKIGPRKKIVDEYDKYCSYIFEYVPFHLGPRLRRDRCNLGSTQGILVGDFVEAAESLIQCARGARCGHALSNLFETTLGGWRKQKQLDSERTLAEYLEPKWTAEGKDDPISLPAARATIVHQLGGNPATAPLKKVFERRAHTFPLVAPAHGDMHATNVLVRHGDAILIDFEKLEEHFPLLYDPASLEGGLLVEGFIKEFNDSEIDEAALVKVLAPLYDLSALKVGSIAYCQPGARAEWFYNAVNQIRTLSWVGEHEPGQYALTLALCLIRKGCNSHPELLVDAANKSRAMAFYFGEKMLRALGRKNELIVPRKKRRPAAEGKI